MKHRQSASIARLGAAQVSRVGGKPYVQVHHRGVGVHLEGTRHTTRDARRTTHDARRTTRGLFAVTTHTMLLAIKAFINAPHVLGGTQYLELD